MNTILKSESSKSNKRLHAIYILLIINLVVYAIFAYKFYSAYNGIYEAEQKLISRVPKLISVAHAEGSTGAETLPISVEPTEMKDWVLWYVKKEGLNVNKISCLIQNESAWKPFAIWDNKNGQGVDRGLWMWNSYWNKHISNECSFDWKCSTIEAVKKIKKDGGVGAWYGALKCK